MASFLQRLLRHADQDLTDALDVFSSDASREEITKGLCALFIGSGYDNRSASVISAEIRRTLSARIDDNEGIRAVAESIDPVFVQEKNMALVSVISKSLDRIGLVVPEKQKNDNRFYFSKISKRDLIGRLMTFWKA